MIRVVYIVSPVTVPCALHELRRPLDEGRWLLDALLGGVARLGAMPIRPSVAWKDGRIELMARADAVLTHGNWFDHPESRAEATAALDMGKPVFESLDNLRALFAALEVRDDEHTDSFSQQVPEGGRPGGQPSHRRY